MALPKLERAYGYELQFFTNHIGHFILVNALLDALTDTGRVVVVGSEAHRRAPEGGIEFDNLDGSKGHRPWRQYGQSKFANLLFAKELARRFKGTGRTADAVHPGVIRTHLTRHIPLTGLIESLVAPLFLKSIAQGAAGQVYLATRPETDPCSGRYFVDCNVATPRKEISRETGG
jgi:WW domain-containing oxidoreductase